MKPAEYDSLHRFAATQRNLFNDAPMDRRRTSRTQCAVRRGFRIRIITHRLAINYFHELAVRQPICWLDNHGIPYRDLCFMKDKEHANADIYIEDGAHHVERLRAAGNDAICFANSTNKDVSAPRASTWDEVSELAHARQRFLADGT